jgi:aminoglycoside 6'-N-acetyltransferase
MLHAGSVLRRAMVDADIDRIVEISRTSDVGRRWQSWDRAHAHAMLADDDLACWVVDLAGDVIGFVQAYAETDPEFRHAGIDLFLDPASTVVVLDAARFARLRDTSSTSSTTIAS